MWKSKEFPHFINSICFSDLIGEVIIINNDISKTPNLPFHDKIVMVDMPTNIMVNPAWNLGFQMAKNDFLCILNDDIFFNLNTLNFVSDNLNDSIGMVGIDIGNTKCKLELVKVNEKEYGFACLFFIHKKCYHKIPKNLNIFYGDNWLFEMNKKNNKQNYKILGSEIFGELSLTSKHYECVAENERLLYENELNKL